MRPDQDERRIRLQVHFAPVVYFPFSSRSFSEKELAYADKWKPKTSEEVRLAVARGAALLVLPPLLAPLCVTRGVPSDQCRAQTSRRAGFRQDGARAHGMGAEALASAPKAQQTLS
jgi:hypothetical protein